MTIRKLYEILNENIPTALSCEWDNDGLMCCPDGNREVRRVLITLDVTQDAVNAAIERNCDLILSHHPLIFKGIKALDGETPISVKAIELITHGIAVMSFHTRLDAVCGGVNDVLANALGLCEVTPFGEEAIGRIGTLPAETTAEEFAKNVKNALNAPVVLLSDAGKPVHRVAVLGGNGGDDVAVARAAGADTYVSGELKYHSLTDAPEEGMNLISAGHFHTEFPVCQALKKMLCELDPAIETELYDNYKIKTI
ncbi:MAG: Nif3-like dinuclear metal center hexameric protein [Clostridia bacterium]|nr:Nif3-like dinuclear metal center hexameric protein [Clostridia bacterium]